MKKRVLVALSAIAALALAASAYAYFSSTGDGSGQASVGSSTAFTVSVSSDSSGTLLPGYGKETLSYTITNASNGTQNLAGTSVSVASKNGDITQNGIELSGCKATWFSVTNHAPTYGPLAAAGTATGSVDVTMPDNTTDNQDPCQGAQPDIAVHAS